MRPAVRRNGARRRASQGTAAKEKHERNVFFFFQSLTVVLSFSLPTSLAGPRDLVRPRKISRALRSFFSHNNGIKPLLLKEE